jgi:mannose-6-phosphate isomerase-like protein (cupin superfamily)
MIKQQMEIKSLNTPDEVRDLPKTRGEVVRFGERSLMRLTLQPGWRWSECVKPTVGTRSCEVAHFNYIISGRLHIRTDDGKEAEIGPGDAMALPPGHDAWVVGNEPVVGLDFEGGPIYGKSTR